MVLIIHWNETIRIVEKHIFFIYKKIKDTDTPYYFLFHLISFCKVRIHQITAKKTSEPSKVGIKCLFASLACISEFMTGEDRQRGDLVRVLEHDTIVVRKPINAVYYRNTQISSRIVCCLDFLIARMSENEVKI